MKHINEENPVANCKTKEDLLANVEEVQTAMTAAAETKLIRREEIKFVRHCVTIRELSDVFIKENEEISDKILTISKNFI